MLMQIDVKYNQVKTLKCSYITSSHECPLFIEGVWISFAVDIVLCRGPAPADPGYSKERRRRRGSGNNCLIKC